MASIGTRLQADAACSHSGLLCQRTAVHPDAAAAAAGHGAGAAASLLPNRLVYFDTSCCKQISK